MKKRLIIIDNVLEMCRLLKDHFSEKFDVYIFNDINDAKNWIFNEKCIPHVVICDIYDGSDYSSLTFLKTESMLSEVPVVAISDDGSSGTRISTLKRGADDFVAKPLNLEELDIRVANLIRQNISAYES